MFDSPVTAHEHGRRERIIEATLDSIVSSGVAGTTMRMVAEAAQVSLGSITYYFADKDDLFLAAFLDYTDRSVKEFDSFYDDAVDLASARTATARMLSTSAGSRRSIILGTELYSMSLRRPRFRMVTAQWTSRCREVMRRHFDDDTTFILDALYEGILLHRTMRLGEYTDERIALAVENITPPKSYIGGGS
ncbi:TetR/AcrR family transcriptional regulator [Corynebacterium guangdongense]|uniref:DNA-binding transcriptional regulator YbjK n=1 Tax=Corynebacterium guangdongense TaxID=1783348 RepID=A0ABU1ZVY0_9CORY|nr:TetR family transcriptional regulator [Corynebacterium guangdongense]MDR7329081.1 DNA-binding transcriptional regulator YbjK [Corynebacterium guangdongense]WJZ17650.1 transcriptional regulator BetI [Corynebacterium guangdongense]